MDERVMRATTERRAQRTRLAGQEAVDDQESGDAVDEEFVAHAARYRSPSEAEGEADDQHRSPPEDGHRIAGQRCAHDGLIEDRAAFHRGQHAGGQPKQNGEDRCRDRQLEGGGKQLGEFGEHRSMCPQRHIEVALQQVAHIGEELHIQGTIESHLVHQLRVPCGVDTALAPADLDRVSRHQPDEKERDEDDPEEGRDDQAEARQNEAQHGATMA
jgi:hypothetical protein